MLINVFSVKGYERWRNFRECPQGELRRSRLPRTSVNRRKEGPWSNGLGPSSATRRRNRGLGHIVRLPSLRAVHRRQHRLDARPSRRLPSIC